MKRFLQSDFFYYFRRDKVVMVSFVIFLVMALIAILAPVLAPHNPYDLASIDIMDSELPPTWMEMGDPRSGWARMNRGAGFYRPFFMACVPRW